MNGWFGRVRLKQELLGAVGRVGLEQELLGPVGRVGLELCLLYPPGNGPEQDGAEDPTLGPRS